jgi:hypothetical protein
LQESITVRTVVDRKRDPDLDDRVPDARRPDKEERIMPYLVLGAVAYSVAKPNFTAVLAPPQIAIDTNNQNIPTEQDVNDFISKLQGMQVAFTSTRYADMCIELRNKVKSRIFGPGATNPLSPGNKIFDVYVNDSRESGDPDVWRSSSGTGLAIHPVTNANYPSLGPINIGVAPHPDPQNPQYWLRADVVAYGP